MTTIKDEPVYDISTAPHPKSPAKPWPWWHYAALAVGAVIVTPLTFIGATTVGHWAFDPRPVAATAISLGQTAKPPKQLPKPPKPTPSYDLAGFKATLSGSDEQAFVLALNRFRRDIHGLKLPTVQSDAVALFGAADTYLADLRQTNPPPGYEAAKRANIKAAIYGRRAASTAQSAVTASDLAKLQKGLAQANTARAALAQAVVSIPKGS